MPQTVKKSRVTVTLAVIVLSAAAIAVETWLWSSRKYYLTSVIIILLAMLPFFARFEVRRPQVREIVLLAVMTFADRFESSFTRRLRRMHLYIIFRDLEGLKPVLGGLRGAGMEISDVETSKSDNKQGIGLFCLMKFPAAYTRQQAFALVEGTDGVLFVEEVDD